MRKTIATFALLGASLASGFAQGVNGMIHGHIQDPAGSAIPNATVQVTTDGKEIKYTFTSDANGDYKGSGIAPGTYVLNLLQGPKPIDQITGVKVVASADQLEDFDLSRPDYIAKMTPEQRKAMEEVKAKNAEALKANGIIKNLNADLAKVRADTSKGRKGTCLNASGNGLGNISADACAKAGGTVNDAQAEFAEADALMTKDSQLKPDAPVIWVELGNAQAGEKKWTDAATSFQKAITLESANPKPNAEIIAGADNGLGEAMANQSKIPDAVAAYDAAAKADPAKAGMYFSNETIVLSRTGQVEATVAAADKAIAADPAKPNPYYFKGQALINKASVDKAGKIVAPPGCAEAYQKYLELAPDGQFATDAKNILAEMGQVAATKGYKAKK